MSNLPKPTKPEPKPLRVTKSNTLITASYRLTLNEQRLILAAISKLDPRRPMPKKVSVSAVDYSDIYGVQLRHAYEQMKVAADELYERDIKDRKSTRQNTSHKCAHRLPSSASKK